MKRSGAIWLVVGVIAVAAVLMYFVVMPQIRDGKTVEDIARQAEETVKDVKQAVNEAGKQVEEVAEGVEQIKAEAIVKMARLGQDAKTAAGELQAALEKSAPSAEDINAAKAKLKTALTEMSAVAVPADAGNAVVAVVKAASDGAKAAVVALDALPQDPAAARAALSEISNKFLATLPNASTLLPGEDTTPAATDDNASAPAATDEQPADQAKADGATQGEKPAEVASASMPAFDLLRVEKDGSTVIAGRAEPGAMVDIVNGDTVIASTQADTSGDFAAVLDDPLSSGDHSIVLKATTKDGKSATSEEVATVSVPKDASGELLAMVTRPGEASKIITMPEMAAADAVAEKSVPSASSKDPASSAEVAKVEVPSMADENDTAKVVAESAATTPDLPKAAEEIASTPPVAADEAEAAKTGEQVTASADLPAVDGTPTTPAEAVESTETRQPAAAPEVMVSAVELEGDRIFIAGNARPGATVRVYADDQIVAEVSADKTGRFVADGTIRLSVGNHTIRADVLSANGAKVELRASVPFFRPEGDLAAVASNDAPGNAPAIEPLSNGAFDKAREEAGKALELLKGLYANGRTPTAEELAAARSSAEIALKSLSTVNIAPDIDPAIAEMAAKAKSEASIGLERLKSVPADAEGFKAALGDVETLVASAVKPATSAANTEEVAKTAADAKASGEVAKTDGDVSTDDMQVTAKVDRLTPSTDAATAEQPAAKSATPAEDTAADVVAADPESQPAAQSSSADSASADQPKLIEQAPLRQSDGSVIIRRGDTLWQISRRVYGKGVRYTTIYVANKMQIEDPDRIKPGQIFNMPGKWLENSEQLHKERLQHSD